MRSVTPVAHLSHCTRDPGAMAVAAKLADLLGGLAAPRLCWSCSGLSRRGDPLCGGCRASLHRLACERVTLCGVPVWAPLAYSGPARDLVRALKYRGAIALADAMAAQIVANAPPGRLEPASAGCTLVPVPLHPRRLRSRGYNQAAAIADAVGDRAGLPVLPCLSRSGPSITQVGRDRAERRAGPAGGVHVDGEVPEQVLLVDDVVTTGATLRACRDALVAAGTREVMAVCFARTIGR
jgi:predicted amidophosphoribosyltransferase